MPIFRASFWFFKKLHTGYCVMVLQNLVSHPRCCLILLQNLASSLEYPFPKIVVPRQMHVFIICPATNHCPMCEIS